MANSLEDRVALVTGAARRIGAAIARCLHQHGANVAIHYRDSTDEAAALADVLNAVRPDSAAIFPADLTSIADIGVLAQRAIAWRKRLDVLVNNASSFYPTPLGTITAEQWDDLVGTNLRAPLFLSQAASTALRASHGVIVNIIDVHSLRPLREHLVYGSAKAGLAMLTRSLAKELAPGVRVNGVSPGAILWPEAEMGEATKAAILDQVPLGRPGSPDDIAGAVLYLVRDATYVTGQIIAVDGGRSVGW